MIKGRKKTAIDKERVFAEAYFKSNNATHAYLAISPKSTKATAGVEGCKYLKKPRVQELVSKMQEKASKNTEMTFEWVMKEYKELYEASKAIEKPEKSANILHKICELYGYNKDKGKEIDLNINIVNHIPDVNKG